MKIGLPYYYVDADMSVLGCTIKKGLQYFVSSIKNKGWLVIKEDRNEMILRGKYANVDDCTMKICYTRYKEISDIYITFPSKPKYKEEIYKNLVDAFNEKYGQRKYADFYNHPYGDKSEYKDTWEFPKVKEDLKEGYYSTGNNIIFMDFIHPHPYYPDKCDTLNIQFVDCAISNKRDMEEYELKKNEKRGFSNTDI